MKEYILVVRFYLIKFQRRDQAHNRNLLQNLLDAKAFLENLTVKLKVIQRRIICVIGRTV